MGDSTESQRRVCGGNGTGAGRVPTDVRTTLTIRWFAWTRRRGS